MSMGTVRTGRARDPVTIRPQPVQETSALPVCEHVPKRGTHEFTVFHGHGWEFCEDFGDEGGAWLPEISEIRHTPGCNGTSERGNATKAIGGMLQKRGIVIPNGARQMPEAYRHYLAAYDVQGGGKFWCYPSVRFTLVKGGRAVIPVIDRSWEYNFRAHLYACGLVPPMQHDVLQSQIGVMQNRIKRIRANAGKGVITNQSATEQIDEINATIAKWDAAFERQFGDMDQPSAPVAPTLTAPTAHEEPSAPAALAPAPTPRKRREATDA